MSELRTSDTYPANCTIMNKLNLQVPKIRPGAHQRAPTNHPNLQLAGDKRDHFCGEDGLNAFLRIASRLNMMHPLPIGLYCEHHCYDIRCCGP